jgi:hypothetical protein
VVEVGEMGELISIGTMGMRSMEDSRKELPIEEEPILATEAEVSISLTNRLRIEVKDPTRGEMSNNAPNRRNPPHNQSNSTNNKSMKNRKKKKKKEMTPLEIEVKTNNNALTN